ncbi:MAG: tRNA 2-thiocytidine biosynthesis TtcA family protein [Pseudomonadota bacterium]
MDEPASDTPLRPPKALLRPVGRAIRDFDMIRDGDRVLVAVSGGKDSLTLLTVLRHLATYAPVHFEVGAVTIDPQVEGFDPSPLKGWMAARGIDYYYRTQPLQEEAQERMQGDSFCSFCSRMKRGMMYTAAREGGYNVLALGQHLDDLAESFLMSAFHGGQLRTMQAHYRIHAGDLRVIRPLALVRERQMADFAERAGLPVIPDSCPACFGAPTEREHVKSLLAGEEARVPRLFGNLERTLRPLMAPDGIPDHDEQP